MKFYFILQFKRIYRHIDEFGVIPIVGLFIIVAVFIGVSRAFFDNLADANYYYVLFGIGLSLKLGIVKRTIFLQKCFPGKAFRNVRMLENSFAVLPFSLFLCYKQFFAEAIAMHFLAIGTSFVNTIGVQSIVIPTPFGKKPFEFVIGFRNYFWAFLLAYFLTGIAISVGNYNLAIFSLLIVFAVCMSFYAKPEPLYYVWIYNTTPQSFLFVKTKTALLHSSFLIVPILLAMTLGFPIAELQYTLVFTLIGYSFIMLAVLGKYHNYPSRVPVFQAMAMLVGLLFPPLVLLMIPIFYRKSIKNLNAILNAQSTTAY